MENEAFNLLKYMAFTNGWLVVAAYLAAIGTALYLCGRFFKWVFKV